MKNQLVAAVPEHEFPHLAGMGVKFGEAQPLRFAPTNFAPLNEAPSRFDLLKSASLSVAPLKFASRQLHERSAVPSAMGSTV